MPKSKAPQPLTPKSPKLVARLAATLRKNLARRKGQVRNVLSSASDSAPNAKQDPE